MSMGGAMEINLLRMISMRGEGAAAAAAAAAQKDALAQLTHIDRVNSASWRSKSEVFRAPASLAFRSAGPVADGSSPTKRGAPDGNAPWEGDPPARGRRSSLAADADATPPEPESRVRETLRRASTPLVRPPAADAPDSTARAAAAGRWASAAAAVDSATPGRVRTGAETPRAATAMDLASHMLSRPGSFSVEFAAAADADADDAEPGAIPALLLNFVAMAESDDGARRVGGERTGGGAAGARLKAPERFDAQVVPGESIAAAVDKVPRGGCVLLRPGVYRESLRLTKSVSLYGENAAVIEHDGAGDVIRCLADHIILDGLSIRYKHAEPGGDGGGLLRRGSRTLRPVTATDSCAVFVESGTVVMQSCDVASRGAAGVHVCSPTPCVIRDSRIHDSAGPGLRIALHARVRVDSNSFFGNDGAGIEVRDFSEASIVGNAIHGNLRQGLYVTEHRGNCAFEQNAVYENGGAGVHIDGGEHRVASNAIYRGHGSGVLVSSGKARIEFNDVVDNGFCGIEIVALGDAVVASNSIASNVKAGVLVRQATAVRVESNALFGNETGIDVRAGGDPVCMTNDIHDATWAGVCVRDGGRGRFESNQIYSNAFVGVAIDSGGDPVVLTNLIAEHAEAGIRVSTRGRGRLHINEVWGCTVGLLITTEGDPVVISNDFHSNGVACRVSHDGRGHLAQNDFWASSGSGLDISYGADPTVIGCSIFQGQSNGIMVSNGGKGRIQHCEVWANEAAGILVCDSGSDPSILGVVIHSGLQAGILCFGDGCRGRIEGCDIYGNKGSGVQIQESADPSVDGCHIHKNDRGLVQAFQGKGRIGRNKCVGNANGDRIEERESNLRTLSVRKT